MVAPRTAGGQGADTRPDTSWADTGVKRRRRPPPPAPADRVRQLLWLGLLGAAVVALWLRMLAAEPHLPLALQATSGGRILLAASPDAALQTAVGRTLQALVLADGRRIPATVALLPQSPRWVRDDAARQDLLALRTVLGQALHPPETAAVVAVVTAVTAVTAAAPARALTAQFDGDLQLQVLPRPRGLGGLGALPWVLGSLALALYLGAVVVALAHPGPAAQVYTVLAVVQSLNLLLIGAGSLPGLGVPGGLEQLELAWRLAADLAVAAALVHLLLLYPRRQPRATAASLLAWGVAAAGLAWLLLVKPAALWWWAQGLLLAAGGVAALLLQQRRGQPQHPQARLLQRLVCMHTGALLLLSLGLALAGRSSLAPPDMATADTPGTINMLNTLGTLGTLAWPMLLAVLLLVGPFLSRNRQLLRDFGLLVGVSGVAAGLQLLLLGLLGQHPLAVLGLALLVSLAVYLLARPWMLQWLAGPVPLGAERLFDSVYRAARALEQSPRQATQLLAGLLREVFDPLEVARSQRTATQVRLAADGSMLVVPVPHLPGQPSGALVLRHAQQGRRLFSLADVQLCERLLAQLRGAVAYDRAVEQGRAEERARIAQDLHDDIGARLLTLMYKAPNGEIEEYIRHTLQDLKTLTRGLAAGNQRLSHAAAEWKADITQRLLAAGCDLHWSFATDNDLTLTAVQWSGLTRVLRELVNNVISHAKASQVEITVSLEHGCLSLVVSDDGIGTQPQAWAHGLGLGGVRKRVKLLGGQVLWRPGPARGIRCEVTAMLLNPGTEPGTDPSSSPGTTSGQQPPPR